MSKYEYAVEIHNANGFCRQLEVYQDYSEALGATLSYRDELNADEYFIILLIEYDQNENEIAIVLVYDECRSSSILFSQKEV